VCSSDLVNIAGPRHPLRRASCHAHLNIISAVL
jgi:hypothetical protein